MSVVSDAVAPYVAPTISQVDLIGEVSTGDITYQDSLLMSDKKCPLCLFENAHSFLLYIPQDNYDEVMMDLVKLGFSWKLSQLIKVAREQNLRYLRIESDTSSTFFSEPDPTWDQPKS